MPRVLCRLSIVACVVLAPGTAVASHGPPPRHAAAFVPGELLVRFDDSATPAERHRVRSVLRSRIGARLWTKQLQRIELAPGTSVADARRAFERQKAVSWAEPNYIYRAFGTPNDPRFGAQWALHNNGGIVEGIQGTSDADVDADQAWDVTTGSGSVIVAVADTGIAPHPDLVPNTLPSIRADLCVDDDLQGDVNGHGTHLAGIIGAAGNNASGIAGVASSTALLPLRTLSQEGGATAERVARAFACAGQRGARVVNASFGQNAPSRAVDEAIANARETLFVAAAGNGGWEMDHLGGPVPSPCANTLPNVVCVAATDQRDELAWFSNWGEVSVDLAAPGVDIVSTHPSRHILFRDDFESSPETRWTTPPDKPAWTWRTGSPKSPTHELGGGTGGWMAEIAQPFHWGEPDCRVDFWMSAGSVSIGDRDQFGPRDLGGLSASTPRNVSFDPTSNANPQVWLRFGGSWSDLHNRASAIDDVTVSCRDAAASPGGFEVRSGTSMAAPHVAGAAALVFAKHPAATPAQVRNVLLDSVDRLPSLAGKVASGGRLNVARALATPLRDDPVAHAAIITTVAGSGPAGDIETIGYPDGEFSGDGGPADRARLNLPRGLAATRDGGYLIADSRNNRVRKVDRDGRITTVAGNGNKGFGGDGGPATQAMLHNPSAVSETPNGDVLILDHENVRVRRVRSDGTIVTAAGDGRNGEWGDGGPAVNASLDLPEDVVALPDGGFLIGESGVRRVWPDGTITSVTKTGDVDGLSLTGDGGYVYTEGDQVKRALPDGRVVVVAGNGLPGFSGDFGPATQARLWNPADVVQTPDGGFLVTDTYNERVRHISAGGVITTVAGGPLRGFTGDGAAATGARLYLPTGLMLTADGGFLFSDWNNHRVRKVASYPRGELAKPLLPPLPDPVSGSGQSGAGDGAAGSPQGRPVLHPKARARVSFKRGDRLRTVLRRGARSAIDCSVPCTVKARIVLAKRTVCKGRLRVAAGDTRTRVVVKCSKAGRRKIARRPGRAVWLEVSVTETASGQALFSGRARLDS